MSVILLLTSLDLQCLAGLMMMLTPKTVHSFTKPSKYYRLLIVPIYNAVYLHMLHAYSIHRTTHHHVNPLTNTC